MHANPPCDPASGIASESALGAARSAKAIQLNTPWPWQKGGINYIYGDYATRVTHVASRLHSQLHSLGVSTATAVAAAAVNKRDTGAPV